MRIIALSLTILIGLYWLIRSNLFFLDGQTTWIYSHKTTFDIIIPIALIFTAAIGLFKTYRKYGIALTVLILSFDSLHRILVGFDHILGFLEDRNIPTPLLPPGSIQVTTNLWPSHIIIIFELCLIIALGSIYLGKTSSIKESSS